MTLKWWSVWSQEREKMEKKIKGLYIDTVIYALPYVQCFLTSLTCSSFTIEWSIKWWPSVMCSTNGHMSNGTLLHLQMFKLGIRSFI